MHFFLRYLEEFRLRKGKRNETGCAQKRPLLYEKETRHRQGGPSSKEGILFLFLFLPRQINGRSRWYGGWSDFQTVLMMEFVFFGGVLETGFPVSTDGAHDLGERNTLPVLNFSVLPGSIVGMFWDLMHLHIMMGRKKWICIPYNTKTVTLFSTTRYYRHSLVYVIHYF